MVFQECFYSFFLLVCKITAFNVYEIIQNTESNSTSEGQGETMQNNCEGQTVSLAIQHVFWEVVLLFFFLLVCEILSPVCPPKKLFKNLHIDIQHFIQQKYHLRGEINILHRKVNVLRGKVTNPQKENKTDTTNENEHFEIQPFAEICYKTSNFSLITPDLSFFCCYFVTRNI